MQIHIQLAILCLSLVAGAITIFFANRLMRKYRIGYLSSYFYFLVFAYIFGVYSIVGSHAIQFYLTVNEVDADTIYSATRFLVALGIPFLLLAWYMFFRVGKELFRKELHWIFVIAYFAFYLLFFLLFILLGLNLVEAVRFEFMRNPLILPVAFSLAALVNFGIATADILWCAKDLTDIHQRKTYRWFAAWYIIFTLLVAFLSVFSVYWKWSGLMFMGVFMGFHLIPVLFLNNYLNLHFVANVEKSDFSENLEKFVTRYNISKREREIVELICKGMTNQQISDSLFISLQTVKDHVHRIFLKTGVKNRIQLSNLIEG